MKTDHHYMLLAINEGNQARITAPPNPWVGCLIVKDGEILGKGFSMPAGGDHAEVVALKVAGSAAKDATVYVTLEPCSHYGKTPPCCEALVNAGVKRVVIGVQDPDPRVSGKGIAYLKKQGITVTENVCTQEVTDSLLPYLHQRSTGRPFIVAKAAISVDGRIAAHDRSSQWISTEEALVDSHRLRAESQAILIGIGTALTDQPKLTVRLCDHKPPIPPLKVVLDPRGELPSNSPLMDDRVLIIKDHLPLESVFKQLGDMGIIQVLVEGGSKVHGALLKERLIDRLIVYVGPRVLGDKGVPLFGNVPVETIEGAPVLELLAVKQLNQTVRLDYSIRKRT